MILTTVILSITLASVFTINFEKTDTTTYENVDVPLFAAEALPNGAHHTIKMEAVKMPDGMYAYRMVEYDLDGSDLVANGIFDTDPSIPGPTIVMTEGDTANITLTNKACDENFVDGGVGSAETFFIGMHTHGVHYDISDDATYDRVNGAETSAAECNSSVEYTWDAGLGTAGTWPYHDHTFSQNEVGAEDVGLFGTVIVNPANGNVDGFVNSGTGNIDKIKVDDIEKEFILWMVSSDVLGQSIFYGMEIDNQNGGKQTPLWVNPTLYASDGAKVRYHVLGIGDETHAFHLHGHRWVESQGGSADIIDVKEITPLQRHTFLVEVSDNQNGIDGTEGWMYHCHFFNHMEQGMSGMMMVLEGDDTLPDVGAVFTLSDEPGLWMKTLNAGIADDLDEALAPANSIFTSLGLPTVDPRPGTGFPLDYLKVISPAFGDTLGRSLAIINPGETVIFNMKDSQTKHTITSLIWPTAASPLGGNGLLTNDVPVAFFDTQLGIRGSTFLTNSDGSAATLDEPGLYVFVCQIHPYMISAVIVDDPTTNVKSSTLGGATLPLLDLSDDLTILTRYPDPVTNDMEFPVTLGPVNALPLELLKDFYVISDPSNWKDYNQDNWEVNVVPALVTTNSEQVVAALHTDTASLIGLATALGITNSTGGAPDVILGAALDSNVPITNADRQAPLQKGVGEIWVNTQFEQTVNKNHPGTPNDKPGTITVVNANDWSIDQKIALPEINMNHPHNMWTDSKNEVVYQTQWFDSRMVVIDRETGEMIKDNFVGQSPSHVMTSPETGKIYIAMNGEETINELDPTTYEITRQISTGDSSHPHGHWISSDGKYVVTPDFLSLSSTIVNLEDNTSVKAEHTGGGSVLIAPIATGMLGSTEKYYTADFLGNTLSVIDIDDAEITHQIDLLEVGVALPIQTPVSPDDKWMVTANLIGPTGPAITVVDTSIDEIVSVLPCDPGCHGVQWGAQEDGGYYAYISNKFSNALIVVDPKDGYDAEIAGKIILTKEFKTTIDDPVIGYAGMGGQGVLAIPNVYEGWIQQTVDECGNGVDPCSEEIADYLDDLDDDQKDPLGS
ncbi:multicopper oxidase type 3 [Candidatus Nitrosopumilus sediminis]|uniref:Multicopper oxidase type 3 n=2 Tax=Candidatus Nitrosopumilus sediminis TaxID=1229909 RepID=K0BCM3_9ARCH|nr:multicopper oxidase type 3 [Candidatus Nitrosopumilus sediminis]